MNMNGLSIYPDEMKKQHQTKEKVQMTILNDAEQAELKDLRSFMTTMKQYRLNLIDTAKYYGMEQRFKEEDTLLIIAEELEDLIKGERFHEQPEA